MVSALGVVLSQTNTCSVGNGSGAYGLRENGGRHERERIHKTGIRLVGKSGYRNHVFMLHCDDNHYESVEDMHMVFCHMIVGCVKDRL